MTSRLSAAAAILGGAATAVSGIAVQAFVQPASTVPDNMWSYPWSADALVPVSVLYAVFHLVVLVGVLGYARETGTTRAARAGGALAVAGTAVLLVAELATLPIRHQRLDDTGPAVVGTVFALGIVLTAVGFLLSGAVMARGGGWQGWRRYVPLATGVWTTLLVGVSLTKALPTGVAIYGVMVMLVGVAMSTRPARQLVTRATVVTP